MSQTNKDAMPPVVGDENDDSYKTKNLQQDQGNTAKRDNPNRNVGGTAKDGGLSTEATVADGGPDDQKEDPTYKPS